MTRIVTILVGAFWLVGAISAVIEANERDLSFGATARAVALWPVGSIVIAARDAVDQAADGGR